MSMNLKFKFFVISSILFISCSEQKKIDLPESIKHQAQKRIDLGYHLGTIIGVIDKNGPRYYSFGQTSLHNDAKPNENSIFEIASLTKPFTSALLADLEIKNEMSIDDPIEKHLPVFEKILKATDRKINLESLLIHTSGLPRNPLNLDQASANRYSDYKKEDLIKYLKNYNLPKDSSKYQYSNLAYLVLEHAIETRMKINYESLVKERIFSPLQMKNTFFNVPDISRNNLVAGFRNGKETEELNVGEWSSFGGIRSTAKDMLLFLGAQLGLSTSSISKAINTTHVERYSDGKTIMGLGWKIMKVKESGKQIYFHKGGTNGFVSFAGFNPKDKIGVVVLVNGWRYFSDLGFNILDPSLKVNTEVSN